MLSVVSSSAGWTGCGPVLDGTYCSVREACTIELASGGSLVQAGRRERVGGALAVRLNSPVL